MQRDEDSSFAIPAAKIPRGEIAQDDWVLEDGRSANRAEKREFKRAHQVVGRDNQRGRRLLRSRACLARHLRPLRAGQRAAALVVTAALAGIEYLVGGNGIDLRDFLRGVMVMARGRCVCLGCGR